MDDGTDFTTWNMPWGAPSNAQAFAANRSRKLFRSNPCDTMCFLKDTNWSLHHRSGLNHTEGDSMKYYYEKDVKITAEMVWNVTKYFMINPDCSFVAGYPQYQSYDGDDENDYPDTVNITFPITSIMPHDKIRVFASLRPINTTDDDDNDDSDGPHDISEEPEQYSNNPSSPEAVLSTTSYSYNYIPAPRQTTPCDGDETVKKRTNESSNIITNRTNEVPDLLATDESQYIQECLCLPYSVDGGEGYVKRDNWQWKDYIINQSGITDSFNLTIPNYMPNATYELTVRIYNSTGIIDGKPDLVWSDETNLSPDNDGSSGPKSRIDSNPVPLILNNGIIVQSGMVNLIVNASDPNADDIEVQVAFINADGNVEYTRWTKPFTQGVNHTKQFTWTHPNATNVRVRTRDAKRSPNQLSNWSSQINITLNSSCHAIISQVAEVLGENLTFEGLQYSIENISTWGWDFNDGTTNSSQNTSYSYNQTGSYQIALNVTDNESNVYTYNTTITILYIKSDFNMSKDSAKINETIAFTNVSKSYYGNITNLTWNFGDGTVIYGNNTPNHNFTAEGIYNVSLTVMDNQSHNHTYTKTAYVDSTPPDILMEPAPTGSIGLGIPVTIYGNFFDNISGIKMAKVNITYPDETTGNYTMYTNNSTPFDYEYAVNDTWQIGQYFYRLWVVDNANNTNYSTYRSFTISNLFGVPTKGDKSQDITNRITGSVFTMHENGVADDITVYLQANQTPSPEVKCHIYRANDSTLVGSTENKTVSTGEHPAKIVFNFTGTKPALQNNTQYIVVCWGNSTCNLSYYNVTDNVSRYKTQTYGNPPQSVSFNNETRYYSLYLQYSTKPYIDNLSITSETIGFGGNVTISANVSHNASGVLLVLAEVEYPDNSTLCYIMENPENDTYQVTFEDTWKVGQYDYTIWAYDRLARTNNTSTYNFTVSANATISICTIEDSYGGNESINITDPPVTSNDGQIQDEWEVMERGDTWNTYYDPVSDEYHVTCYTDLINYQNETGAYLPINTSVKMESATVNDEQFEYGVTKGTYQAFWKQNTNDQEDESLVMLKDGWMLTQKPDSELVISYNKIQSVHTIGVKTTGQASVQGNVLSYADQYQCQGMTTGFADLQYEYQPSLLKANLVLTNPSFLFNRFQAVKQFFDEDNLWLGYATTLFASSEDNTSATMGIMVDDSVIRGFGNATTGEIWTEDQIWFTDDTDNPVLGIPELYARDSQGNETVLMKHLAFDENGEIRISIYTPMSWLTDSKREYPVYVDPSVSVYSETGDGWALQDDSTNWDTVHDGSGSNSRDWDTSNYGVGASCGVNDKYSVRRAFFRFNTTDAIPDETVITGASLNIRGAFDSSPPYPTPTASGVVFQKWTGGGTVSNGDYNDFTGSYYGSKASWSTFSYNSIPWTYSRDEINLDGWTDVCLREWAHDYNDSAPGGETSYSNKMVFADSAYNKPYLSISYQYPPAITGVTPANNIINVSIAPTLSITVNHTNGDNMTITWSNKINGTWQEFASDTTNGNETCIQTYDNATENGQWWEWKVNVTNGTAYREKEYRFYAGVQSKINNSGSTDISGYLLLNVSYYNETLEEWKYDMDVLWTYVTINASEELGLDTLFNDILNTDDLSFGNGTYRITVALIDPYGDILVYDDDTKLEATYEFEVEY